MSFDNTGKTWSARAGRQEFRQVVHDQLGAGSWKPKGICFHHTGAPSLETRPHGLTVQHIRNMRDYYRLPRKGVPKGWSAGPHLFVDDQAFFGMTPFGERGVHAVAFNASDWGIEVLGDYDVESPVGTRGYECWKNGTMAAVLMLRQAGLVKGAPDAEAWSNLIRFHREDKTTSKSCPGTKVTRAWVIKLMMGADAEFRQAPIAEGGLTANAVVITAGRAPNLIIVPVMETACRLAAVTPADLTAKDGYTFLFGKEVSGAYYDKVLKRTLAPETSVEAALRGAGKIT